MKPCQCLLTLTCKDKRIIWEKFNSNNNNDDNNNNNNNMEINESGEKMTWENESFENKWII